MFKNLPAVTLADQIESLKRELRFRRRVYARKVEANTMTLANAQHEIACTTATLQLLEQMQSPPTAPGLFDAPPMGNPAHWQVGAAVWCSWTDHSGPALIYETYDGGVSVLVYEGQSFGFDLGGFSYDDAAENLTYLGQTSLNFQYNPGTFISDRLKSGFSEAFGQAIELARKAGKEVARG